jgi:hypothetical protein
MTTMRVKTLILAAAALATVTACSQAKEQLGLTRSAPDEFAVVKRAPLAMPPDFALRPPRPGAARPQEQHPEEQAKVAVFGQSVDTGDGFTKSEAAFLDQAGAFNAQPDIREAVDQETAAMAPKTQPVAKRLLNIGSDDKLEPATTVVDPKAEAERLKQNKETGQPVTAGDTPSIEQ